MEANLQGAKLERAELCIGCLVFTCPPSKLVTKVLIHIYSFKDWKNTILLQAKLFLAIGPV